MHKTSKAVIKPEPRNVPVTPINEVDKTVAASSCSPNLPAKRRLMVNKVLCKTFMRIGSHDRLINCLSSRLVSEDKILLNKWLVTKTLECLSGAIDLLLIGDAVSQTECNKRAQVFT